MVVIKRSDIIIQEIQSFLLRLARKNSTSLADVLPTNIPNDERSYTVMVNQVEQIQPVRET